MNNGAFGENFPYTNFHELNMDWIIKIAKDFLDQYTTIQDIIETGKTDLTELAETLEAQLNEWYDTHSEELAQQIAEGVRTLQTALTNAVTQFGTEAEQKALQTIATIPSDYSTLANNALQYRADLSGADPRTATVLPGIYASRKLETSTGYPDDMTVGHYCLVEYLTTSPTKRYLVYDVTNGDSWLYVVNTYFKYAKDSEVMKYWGDLAGEDPKTSTVNIGIYTSRKLETSTGYPDDMTIGHYCIIEYHTVTPTKHFVLIDVNNGYTWYYTNNTYYRYAFNKDMSRLSDIINTQYTPLGNKVTYIYNTYKVISSADGTITTLSTTEANAHFKVTNPIAITENDELLLNMTMRFNNGVIVFYNQNNEILKWINAGDIAENVNNYFTIINYVAVPPAGTTSFAFGYNDNYPVSVKVINGYSLIPKTLARKKWACIGDSITDANNPKALIKYYDYIVERTGLTFINLGVDGTGYAREHDGENDSFISRVSSIPNDTDIVTIFGSGNDMNTDLPVGTYTDTDGTTLMGKVYQTLQSIFTNKPKVLVGIISPLPWATFPPYNPSSRMSTYVNEMKKLCELYSVPFLDLFHGSNMRPWEETFRNNYYSKDNGGGTHPDEEGNKRFAPIIQKFIESILVSN